MGRETKELGAKPTSYCLTFICCQPCLPNFQCFQSCVSWTPFCIFSFCYFSYAVVSGTYLWVYLRKIKSDYHGWLNMMTSSEGPFLVLPRPSNPKPTTAYDIKLYSAARTFVIACIPKVLQHTLGRFSAACNQTGMTIGTKMTKVSWLSRNPGLWIL